MVFAAVSAVVLYAVSIPRHEILASADACPASMPPAERLACLQEQAAIIQERKSHLEGSINAEDLEQLSLYEQISYLASRIEEAELNIAELEINIEKKNVEVSLLGEDILDIQNNIDTLTQEINVLEDAMKKRTKSSYKMTFMSPLEILLDSADFETLMRKMKYIIEVKKKDRTVLSDMSLTKNQLKDEEAILEEKRNEVQTKRNEIESERAELAEERTNLESQQGQQHVLLAQSQQREQEYLAQLEDTRSQQSALDAQIAELIAQMWESGDLASEGYVTAGTPIGLMGSTGCSTGAHLHFSINDGSGHPTYWYFYGNINPWAGYLVKGPDAAWTGWDGWVYYYIHPGAFILPVAAPVVITQDFHQGMSIDMVSLQGAGAVVYAAHSGMLTRGVESICGGKFAVVEGDGIVTGYLHLQ